jgi:hypothetical protein
MSILDDAIREHLELKRAHGADEAELKKLEDEAFGPPGRPDEPDSLAEAPTEFMSTPEAPGPAQPGEEGGRRINVADLQEAPPAPAEPQEEPRVEATDGVEAPEGEAAALAPAEDPAQAAPPAEEEPPAMEHEVVPEAETPAETSAEPAAEIADGGHSTEERHAIAEQPTEFFDVEAEMGTEDAAAPTVSGPAGEESAEPEAAEPIAPVEPPTEIHATRTTAPGNVEDEEDEEFWSDQRLSEELDQALEAPLTDDEHEITAPTPAPSAETADAPAPTAEPTSPLFDQGEDEEPAAETRESEPASQQREEDARAPESKHEDVLEDTPEFLEDAPEDDELWFEQRPPKDIDFGD